MRQPNSSNAETCVRSRESRKRTRDRHSCSRTRRSIRNRLDSLSNRTRREERKGELSRATMPPRDSIVATADKTRAVARTNARGPFLQAKDRQVAVAPSQYHPPLCL